MKWIAEFWIVFFSLSFVGMAFYMFALWDSDAVGILSRMSIENRTGILFFLCILSGGYVLVSSAGDEPPLASFIRSLWPFKNWTVSK